MSDVKNIVNKLLEGNVSVRKILEGSSMRIKLGDFLDSFIAPYNKDYVIVGGSDFWYDCLLKCSSIIKEDYDKTFEDENLSLEDWFYKHYGVVVETWKNKYSGEWFAYAPYCEEAPDLEDFVCLNTYFGGVFLDNSDGTLNLIGKL